MSTNNSLNEHSLNENRDGFKTNVGFIFATAGSAIGLGNIWRFPYMTGTNGGGAFLFVYLICMVLVGVSLLLVEFAIGRHGQANAIDSYGKISKSGRFIGFWGFFSAFIFLAYYSVVSGWTIYYMIKSFTGLVNVPADGMWGFFGGFISNPVVPLVYHAIFMGLTIFIVMKGVSAGIEKYSRILMPALFVMLIVLVFRSLTLPGAMEGVKWYLTPDFSAITGKTWLAALGQVFFSLSVGMSGMVTYASYLKKDNKLPQTAFTVAFADTGVALLAGFAIFPAMFAFGIEPGSGVGLVFVTLPTVFGQMPLGFLFSGLFFALLCIANITSSISILEMPVAYITEKTKTTRLKAALIVGAVSWVLGVAVSFSFGIWGDFTIFGKGIFDLFDWTGSNILLPLGGLMAAVLVGWVWKKDGAMAEISNNGENAFWFNGIWFGLVKYVVPVVLVVIFFMGIGLF
jgi:NSS family neurotransmitter:Na+ symporter